MPRVPYKVGEVVVGDEPLNGRQEGIVVAVHEKNVGVRCTTGEGQHDVYYDYREVRRAR